MDFVELAAIFGEGMIVAMIICHIVYAVYLVDGIFLTFAALLVVSLIYIGWLSEFYALGFGNNNGSWIVGLYTLANTYFINEMLLSKDGPCALGKISIGVYTLAVLLIIAPVLPVSIQSPLEILVVLVSVLYFVLLSLKFLKKGVRLAYIMIVAWTPVWGIFILQLLSKANLLVPFWSMYPTDLILATAWASLIFSFALAYEIGSLKKQQLILQRESLISIQEQKERLESKVLERTEEIMAQNEHLLANQLHIKTQNEKLETQNEAYKRLRKMILKQNHELEKAVEKRTKELAIANEDLKKYISKLEHFSFISAHNLRAPVARILGLANLLSLSQNQIFSHEREGIIDKIHIASTELDNIINDLKGIIEVPRTVREDYQYIKLGRLANQLMDKLCVELNASDVEFSCISKGIEIYASHSSLMTILEHLIRNCLSFRSANRTTQILLVVNESQSFYSISLKDNGKGFNSEKYKAKLFSPYQKFTDINSNGKGLGLFMVKTILDSIKGGIKIRSKENVGTQVEITLPKTNSMLEVTGVVRSLNKMG